MVPQKLSGLQTIRVPQILPGFPRVNKDCQGSPGLIETVRVPMETVEVPIQTFRVSMARVSIELNCLVPIGFHRDCQSSHRDCQLSHRDFQLVHQGSHRDCQDSIQTGRVPE
jgi:hypothetical protein